MLKPTDVGLTSEDIHLIVERFFKDVQIQPTIQDAWVEGFAGSPDGFLADHFALKIEVSYDESKREELSFFMKVIPTGNPLLAKYLEEIGSFRKEVILCEKVIPRIQEQIPENLIVPRYLLTKDYRLIVMENVKLKGYDILKGNSGLMNYGYLEKAFDALAHFHAGSILLEEKEGKGLLEMFPGALEENAWTGDEESIRTRDVENVIVLLCEYMRIVERDSGRLKQIIAELPGTIRSLYDYVKSSKRWRNVFSHGDLWSNNVMFRNTLAGLPLDCILVDFQLSRYTPPAYDINLLLSLTTTRDFRLKHMEFLLEGYYNTFQQTLNQRGIDCSKIYTKESFLESCKYYRLAGQIHGCIIAPEVLLPQCYLDEVFACSAVCAGFMPQPKVNICLKAFQTNEDYRERLLDMVQELLPEAVCST